jgi:hypothetical protein
MLADVTTFVGGCGGAADGSGSNACFLGPGGIALDLSNNFWVAEYGNQRVRKVTAAGGTY